MGQTKTYDPAKHLFSFLGNLIAGGYGPDTFIKVTRDEDGFSAEPGASGEVTRSKNNNRMGTVELTLLASSQNNDVLAAIAAADELGASAVGPLFLKEFNGTMTAAAENAWIKKQPDIERGKVSGVYTWVFGCADLEVFAGGLV